MLGVDPSWDQVQDPMQKGQSQVHAAPTRRHQGWNKDLTQQEVWKTHDGRMTKNVARDCAFVGKVHLGSYHGGEVEICHHHEIYQSDAQFLDVYLDVEVESDPQNERAVLDPRLWHMVEARHF